MILNTNEKTRNLMIAHCHQYPLLQIRDIFKYIYQSSFGCKHLVSSLQKSTDFIRAEYSALLPKGTQLVDRLDGDYSRVHLDYLNHGLCAGTLGMLFFESAKTEPNGGKKLENMLCVAKQLAREGKIPFSVGELEAEIDTWAQEGYPPVHHSDAFRKEYLPSYRVISNRYVPFLPLFAKLDRLLESSPAVVAIEGGSASGKSTLGETLKKLYDCTLFHTDDFFLQKEQRTTERYAQIGGNIDRERFVREVLAPLKKGATISYRRFDCTTMTIMPPVEVKPKALVVIEGAYSMHPEFEKYYDFSVFLNIGSDLQRERIAKRNSPDMAEQFFKKWLPLERVYFEKTKAKERCSLNIDIL